MQNRIIQFLVRYITIIIALFSAIIIYVAWSLVIKTNLDQQKEILVRDTEVVKTDLEKKFKGYEDTLVSIKGLFDSSEFVSREEFIEFVSTLDLTGRRPEFVRVSFVNAINTNDIAKFDKDLLIEGYKDYKSNIDKSLNVQYMVNYISDSLGRSYPPTGINLALDSDRLEMVNSALSSKSISVSNIVKIANVPEESSRGFILTTPVYDKNNQLYGFINVLVSTNELGKTYNNFLENLSKISLLDNQTEIFNVSNNFNKKIITQEIEFDIFNKNNLKLSIEKPVDITYGSHLPRLVIIAGIVIALLLIGIVHTFTLSNRQAHKYANEMTLDLRKYKLALDSASNHIIITDKEGVIIYANSAAEKITGFTFAEMIGKTPRLWGGQMTAEFYKNLWDTVKNKKLFFGGEITNKRKNGEIYIAMAGISPILDENNQLLGFVGIEEDITDEKNDAEKDKKQKDELERLNKLMVGRELKMIELKKEIKKIKEEK